MLAIETRNKADQDTEIKGTVSLLTIPIPLGTVSPVPVPVSYRFVLTVQGPTITETEYKPGRASSTWNLLVLLQPLLALPHNQNDSNNSTQLIT